MRLTLLLALAVTAFGESVTFDHPVQIPEATLQPGKYTIRLEDRLNDRAIVRITEPNGADHYLLTVPSKTLTASASGLIFFDGTQAVHGWECPGCKAPLEFVYPKDDAVKLAGEAGKPVLAYDPSYDKLPANLSAADRKVVTLWLLAPKTVTPEGRGVGLTAAKYSVPKVTASADPLPKTMPKTASLAFFEILAGFLSFVAGTLLFLWRKLSALPAIWKLTGLTMLVGMVTGFALPVATSYQTEKVYRPKHPTLEIPTVVDENSEVERLKARNRRLEVLVETLSHRQ